MGQKAFSMLDKADSSLVWTASIFDRKYKWLSYNLSLSYIQFYKNILFFNVKFKPLKKYNISQNIFFFKPKGETKAVKKESIRFSYHLDLYFIEVLNYLLILNIYFLINLEYLKRSGKQLKEEEGDQDDDFFF